MSAGYGDRDGSTAAAEVARKAVEPAAAPSILLMERTIADASIGPGDAAPNRRTHEALPSSRSPRHFVYCD
ncbi:hypothetical protein ElP_74200 (plasmid) [Tautonia plasticadhaerens]|uniref:Uncharacterized protein n=1 Tax=Tautonia plasticadhaerens TaxID=2527974 RepID=A0A518HF29_9BACT|nr:hypothetical protein ElP_74200 [Tautonia plasticadhaerens]